MEMLRLLTFSCVRCLFGSELSFNNLTQFPPVIFKNKTFTSLYIAASFLPNTLRLTSDHSGCEMLADW